MDSRLICSKPGVSKCWGPLPVSINEVLLAHGQLVSVLSMAASVLQAARRSGVATIGTTRPKTHTLGPSLSQSAHPGSQRPASHRHPSATISFHSLPHSPRLPCSFKGTRQAGPLKPCPRGSLVGLLCSNHTACSSNSGRTCLNQTSFQMAALPRLKKPPHIHAVPPTNYLSPYH